MDAVEVFVRGVWKFVPDEENTDWVDRVSEASGSMSPMGDYGPIVKEMLSKGVSSEKIARFAKIIGYETAFCVCAHLGDSSASYEGAEYDDDERIHWSLFQVDSETDQPLQQLTGLHEIMLSMDPTGCEMVANRNAKC